MDDKESTNNKRPCEYEYLVGLNKTMEITNKRIKLPGLVTTRTTTPPVHLPSVTARTPRRWNNSTNGGDTPLPLVHTTRENRHFSDSITGGDTPMSSITSLSPQSCQKALDAVLGEIKKIEAATKSMISTLKDTAKTLACIDHTQYDNGVPEEKH